MEPSSSTSESSAANAATPTPRFQGHPVVLGGVTYIIPALSLRSIKELQPELARLGNGGSDDPLEHLADVTKVIHAALVRNYPDIQFELLADLIDMQNLRELLRATTGKPPADGPQA